MKSQRRTGCEFLGNVARSFWGMKADAVHISVEILATSPVRCYFFSLTLLSLSRCAIIPNFRAFVLNVVDSRNSFRYNMSANNVCTCGEEDKNSVNSKLSGIRLFKSIVRRVRQKITESKPTNTKSSSSEELPAVIAKLDRMSVDDMADGNTNGRTFSPPTTLSGSELRNGYSSDSGTERRRDTRVRIRQKIRSRSKSDSRKSKKKPKNILRPPPSYIYVRGLSGIPTQRIRVR